MGSVLTMEQGKLGFAHPSTCSTHLPTLLAAEQPGGSSVWPLRPRVRWAVIVSTTSLCFDGLDATTTQSRPGLLMRGDVELSDRNDTIGLRRVTSGAAMAQRHARPPTTRRQRASNVFALQRWWRCATPGTCHGRANVSTQALSSNLRFPFMSILCMQSPISTTTSRVMPRPTPMPSEAPWTIDDMAQCRNHRPLRSHSRLRIIRLGPASSLIVA